MLIFSLLAVFFLNFLIISAMAGTETGEFCPTCPDWTNLDGWLAKKDAYERAQMGSQQDSGQTAGQTSNTVTDCKGRSSAKGICYSPISSPAPHPSRAIRMQAIRF